MYETKRMFILKKFTRNCGFSSEFHLFHASDSLTMPAFMCLVDDFELCQIILFSYVEKIGAATLSSPLNAEIIDACGSKNHAPSHE